MRDLWSSVSWQCGGGGAAVIVSIINNSIHLNPVKTGGYIRHYIALVLIQFQAPSCHWPCQHDLNTLALAFMCAQNECTQCSVSVYLTVVEERKERSKGPDSASQEKKLNKEKTGGRRREQKCWDRWRDANYCLQSHMIIHVGHILTFTTHNLCSALSLYISTYMSEQMLQIHSKCSN